MSRKPDLRLVDSGDRPLDQPHQTNMFGSQPSLSIVPEYTQAVTLQPQGRVPHQLSLSFPVTPLTKEETDDLELMMVYDYHLGG